MRRIILAAAVWAAMSPSLAVAKDLGVSRAAAEELFGLAFRPAPPINGAGHWHAESDHIGIDLVGNERDLSKIEYAGRLVKGSPGNVVHFLVFKAMLGLAFPNLDPGEAQKVVDAVVKEMDTAPRQKYRAGKAEIRTQWFKDMGLMVFTIDAKPEK